jgi:hypothetical protein
VSDSEFEERSEDEVEDESFEDLIEMVDDQIFTDDETENIVKCSIDLVEVNDVYIDIKKINYQLN